jgi:O-antigen/teichoic acid export membrane protein
VSSGPRSILANAGYRLLADVASKVASLAFFVVMARELGTSGFGIFTFALAFVILATTLGTFGQDVVLTREVARDRTRLGGYFANTLTLKVVLVTISLAVSIGVAAAAGIDRQTLEVLLLLGPAVMFELLMATCFASYQAFERLEFIPIALISQRSVTAAVGIAALLNGAGVVAVSAIYLVGSGLGFALALWFLVRKVARPGFQVQPSRWWPLMGASFAIGLAGVFSDVFFRIDTAMLAAFRPKEVVGNYGAAYRLFEATLFVAWSVGAAVYPVFSRLTTTTVPPVGLVFRRSLKLVVALTLPLAVGGLVLAGPLMRLLYGSSYESGATALRLLTPAIVLYPICYVSGYLLVSQDRQRVLTWVYGLVALENILANLVLIPWLSLNGAALSTSISQLLVAVALVFFAQRAAGQIQWGPIVGGAAVASVLAAAAMAGLGDSVGIAVPAGALVYLVAIVLFERFFFPADAQAVLGLLTRRRATGEEAV